MNNKNTTVGAVPKSNRKMKKQKYHTVGTDPKSNRKMNNKNTTLSEQFQNLIEK